MNQTLRLALLPLAFAVCVGLTLGCESNDTELTAAEADDVMKRAKLDGVPAEVEQKIMNELGTDTTITGTDITSTDGGMVYSVTYLEDGEPKSATFDSEGSRIDGGNTDAEN